MHAMPAATRSVIKEERMAKICVITSGKGGVGKTTAAAAIGAGLAASGVKTILVDLDLGLRNLDVSLGLETQVFYHIGDVVRGIVPAGDALVTAERYPNLALLAAAQTVKAEWFTEESLRRLLAELSALAEIILIDCPAGIGEYFRSVIPLAGEGIVLTAPVVSAVRDADKVLHLLEEAGVRKRSIIVNGVRPELVRKGAMMKPEEITDVLGAELLGVIPDDDAVISLANEGRPVYGGSSPAAAAYGRIVRRLLGESVPIPPIRKKKGWFSRY